MGSVRSTDRRRRTAAVRRNGCTAARKRVLAAILGAFVLLWLVVLAGAIWGGVDRIKLFDLGLESRSSEEDTILGAFSGGMGFALSGGLPAILSGILIGQLAVSILFPPRTARLSVEQRRGSLNLFADVLLLLTVVVLFVALSCVFAFFTLFVLCYGGE